MLPIGGFEDYFAQKVLDLELKKKKIKTCSVSVNSRGSLSITYLCDFIEIRIKET